MATPAGEPAVFSGRPRQRNRLRWGMEEFLGVPLAVVFGLAVLAGLAITADRASASWLASLRATITRGIQPDTMATMLQSVTPGLLTAISIVFFVMVMAVQQQAGTYTTAVLDQFMLRRLNQVFIGLFVGLAVYFLAVLTLVSPERMVVSGAVASLLAVVTLPTLLVFIYNIFDQMRPSSSAALIEHLALQARVLDEPLLSRCRATPVLTGTEATDVRTSWGGYVTDIDVDALAIAIRGAGGPVEIEFHVVVGAHIVPGDTVAQVRGRDREDRERLASAVLDALIIGRTRDVSKDAGYSVDQLAAMAWSASSSQQDPEAASVATGALHTLLACWGGTEPAQGARGDLPIVYTDEVLQKVLDALTSVVVATGQSGQHQTCSEVLMIFSTVLPRLTHRCQRALVDELGRVVSTATAHVLSVRMERAIDMLRRSLYESDFHDTAARLEEIETELSRQVRELSAAGQT